MLQRTLIPLVLLFLMLLSPSALLADVPAGGQALLGKWELSKTIRGDRSRDVEPGQFAAEFLPGGVVKTYRGGEFSEEGKYVIDGDKLSFDFGDDDTETGAFKITGDEMSFTQQNEDGEVEVSIYKRLAAK